MGLLTKLMHREDAPETSAIGESGRTGEGGTGETPECVHTILLPRWESVDDMGREEKATGFHCDTCGQDFTPDEAASLRASEGDRLRLATELPE